MTGIRILLAVCVKISLTEHTLKITVSFWVLCVEANYPTDSLLEKTKETQHVLFFVIPPSTGHENNAPHPKTGKCSRAASHFHRLTVV